MPIRVRLNSIEGLGLLLLIAMVAGPAGAQNQTPANVAPPTSVRPLVNAEAISAVPPPARVAPPAWQKDAWKDPNTGLMWALRDNGSAITQANALKYCRSLTLAGFKDWRLPAIDELAGLYDLSIDSGSVTLYFGEEIGEQSWDVHIKGGIRLTGTSNWSTTPGNRSGEGLTLDFSSGTSRRTRFDSTRWSIPYRALCVRRAGE